MLRGWQGNIDADRDADSPTNDSIATRNATGNAETQDARARYVDPLLPKSLKIFVPFSKPFGYTYQDEYRFC